MSKIKINLKQNTIYDSITRNQQTRMPAIAKDHMSTDAVDSGNKFIVIKKFLTYNDGPNVFSRLRHNLAMSAYSRYSQLMCEGKNIPVRVMTDILSQNY